MLGEVIGNYRVTRKIGEGGMGAVYLGEHALLGRTAAIKVLLPALSTRPDIVQRFFNEARAATSIHDPGIVQIFDFGFHTDQSAFIVMEFLEGETLEARLRALGRLALGDALRIARQVATTLAAAHARQIVHRDLKPENVFLVRDAEVAYGERAKILDFGIAKLQGDHSAVKTSAGALMGTPLYMSPEQCHGAADLDHRSDIYALGCVLFHAIVGRPPFEAEGMGQLIVMHMREIPPLASALVGGVPPEVDALLARCLAKHPSERFQSMHEVAAAITQLHPSVTGQMGAVAGNVTPILWSTPSQPGPGRTGPPSAYPGAGTPVPQQPPTTLGASAGQVAAPPKRGAGWIIAMCAALVGAGIAVVAFTQLNKHAASAPVDDTMVTAPRDAAVAKVAPVVPPAVDAAAAVAQTTPVDAPAPPPAPVDAAVVVPAIATQPPPAHHHHNPAPPPAGKPATPDCPDCNGIPDHR